MKPNVVLLLFLSGVISCALSIVRPVSHKYHMVELLATWPVAQKYCREHYEDIATVASGGDLARLYKEGLKHSLKAFVWVGLYNDVNSWRWSYNEIPLKNTTLRRWGGYEPLNTGGREWCVIIDIYGYWWDYPCTIPRPFVCFNANNTGIQRFIGVYYPYLDWYWARYYCRKYYTDLASAITLQDNSDIQSVVYPQGNSWFGLYRDNWKWSDGTKSFYFWWWWYPGDPTNYWGREDCGIQYGYGFGDAQCTDTYYFYCQTTPPARYQQVLKLKVTSDYTILDPAVQALILELVMQKLEENGMLENSTVTWRVQSDETIFRKKKIDEP